MRDRDNLRQKKTDMIGGVKRQNNSKGQEEKLLNEKRRDKKEEI